MTKSEQTWSRGAVVLGLLLTAATASAQDVDECDGDALRRGPEEVTPADGAGAVTLDASIKVRYSPGYFSEPGIDPPSSIELFEEESGEQVAGSVQVNQDTLFFRPTARLTTMTRYEGTAFGIDADLPFRFTTGRQVDERSPTLGPIHNVDSSRVDARCGAPEGGYRIDVSFEPAADDGPVGSIEHLLFQTRGIGVGEPRLVARDRAFTTDLTTMAFVLETSDAVEPICVAVQAVDGVGRVDEDGQPVCFDPISGNFFEPVCTTPGPLARTGGVSGAALPVLLATLAVSRRRRRRRRPEA